MICVLYPQGKIGDLIWHEPFFRFISEIEKKKIILITRKSTQADKLLSNSQYIERFIFHDFKKGTLNYINGVLQLRRIFIDNKVSKLWILDKISRPAIAGKLANINTIFGYGAGAQKYWITNKLILSKSDLQKHYIQRGIDFFSVMNLPIKYQSPKTYVNNSVGEVIRNTLSTKLPIICYGIDSSEKHRMWPVERFIDIIKKVEKYKNFHHAIIAGPNNSDLCQKIISNVGNISISEHSSYSIEQICGLLKISNVFVGNDSGPYNLSASVERISIGLHGNTKSSNHSEYFIPVFPESGEINAISDRRIDKNGNEIKDIKYMYEISTTSVLNTLITALQKLNIL